MQIITRTQDGAPVTMTSVELVDFINEERKAAGGKTLQHSDFLKKVPLVLKEGAGNFSCTYSDSQGKERPAYRFPKREACLMAMSYSYDLQAKVFDRMTALEQGPAANLPAVRDPQIAALIFALTRVDAIEQEQQRQSTELARVQETVAVLEARTQPENKHFTVLGYSNLVGKPIDVKTASRLGRKCADLSRSQGMVIGDVKDPRFGTVHSYHESVLQAVFATAEA